MLAPASSLVTTERRRLEAAVDIAGAWRDLAARAIEPNIFYEPDFAFAAASPATGLGRSVEVILVWSADVSRRLVGLFPFRLERWRYFAASPVLVGWTHRFAPFGTPLVDRELCIEVVAAFFDHVAGDDELPGLLLLPFINESGPVAAALREVLARRRPPDSTDRALASFGSHFRAALRPDGDRAGYLDHVIGAKRRKELRRQRHRLADRGEVAFTLAATPQEVLPALEEFLRLEAAGWKGRAGTAMAQHPAIRGFVEHAIKGLAAAGKVRVAQLTCAARAIASVVVLRSGGTAWSWKVAYDESFAASSPGVQAFLDLTDVLLADKNISAIDSCAAPGHPMIDHIWRERIPLADWLIATRPRAPFALACRMETARRGSVAFARRLRDRLRR